ncbi:MAG TPA: tetrahydrofolate dehydrogenase/cyclohydrolase catalytic domain-containing protein [Longimicrobiales bacterium]|nr:tetrahydrofolate dehydrogenase/cyclohydrolase catalytic domain-containing protein [Longimicrobiales bacterium]
MLDGVRLAAARLPLLAQRATAVRSRRGSPPALLIAAFAEGTGTAPHVVRKLNACAAAGVAARPLILPATVSAADAGVALRAHLAQQPCDGVFLQFPFPPSLDAAALSEAIPPALDVDVMTRACVRHYFTHTAALPPVTVSAGLLLLDAYGMSLRGRTGVIVAEATPFSLMFAEALARQGVAMRPLLAPHTADLATALRGVDVVVVAVAQPAGVSAAQLPAAAVAIDVGYFNPGGRGDIDTSRGAQHLAALAPVPGGIGPMTVSALIERTILFAESSSIGRSAGHRI